MSGSVVEPPVSKHVFHDEAAAVGAGKKFKVGAFKAMTFSGKGTSASRTVQFRGIDVNGTDELINGYDRGNAEATGFTVNGKQWQVPIEGLEYFYIPITAIDGGDETIVGEATI